MIQESDAFDAWPRKNGTFDRIKSIEMTMKISKVFKQHLVTFIHLVK